MVLQIFRLKLSSLDGEVAAQSPSKNDLVEREKITYFISELIAITNKEVFWQMPCEANGVDTLQMRPH